MTSHGEDDGGGAPSNICCISHEFYKIASKNPTKIAVIHASGGARVSREVRNKLATASSEFPCDIDRFFDEQAKSKSPPIYEGDQCFTYSDVLRSVDSLSCRLNCILRGDHDPHLIKPPDNDICREGTLKQFSNHSLFSSLSVDQATKLKHACIPKIFGILMLPSVEYVVAVLSVIRCGGAFLPLDPSWPKERIQLFISSSNIELVISCGSSFVNNCCCGLDRLDWLVDSTRCSVLYFSVEDQLQESEVLSDIVFPCKKGVQRLFSYLMYTSGSTGKPKGVCGTEQGLLNRFLWMQELYPLHGKEILLFKTSISFIDHVQEFLCSILTACILVIPPSNELKDNIYSVADFVRAYLINRLTAVPSFMRMLLPSMKDQCSTRVSNSLRLLMLSGEVLPLSLWDMLCDLLPNTIILNIYGSTEVSGDCTYFDCKRLPTILKTQTLTSVPIGVPISNCDVVLVGDKDTPHQGEIHVRGLCVSAGYLSDSLITPLDSGQLHKNYDSNCPTNECGNNLYFRTGDFARRLESGDLVFVGRKDRTFKVNGQRIALEEIETTLKGHSNVVDAVVLSTKFQEDLVLMEAFVILSEKDEPSEFRSSIKSWMNEKLPSAMIPNHFIFTESFPMTSSGKVDYEALAVSTSLSRHIPKEDRTTQTSDILDVIKKAFCNALMIEKLSNDDDLFMLGGNSIVAAHVSHSLGIDMRFLYSCPTPSKLQKFLLKCHGSSTVNDLRNTHLANSDITCDSQVCGTLFPCQKNDKHAVTSKRLKVNGSIYSTSRNASPCDEDMWKYGSLPMSCSFSRCNKVMYERGSAVNDLYQSTWSVVLGNRVNSMQELWKVHMEACVDASPVVVFKGSDIYLFIGSHSHKFLCINGKSGSVQWETKLGGRIECSAAVTEDFSQVVVGCYDGNIYFLDFSTGNICWTFEIGCEVKSQPVIDSCRELIWCGSHDHNLYALDCKNQCCVYKHSCGGSIFGSPAIDEVLDTLYVASTSGRLVAISIIKDSPFHTLWLRELQVPVFGSLSVTNSNVICCLVDGHVLALDSSGTIIWRTKTSGPIFAGACISYSLPSQILISSRSGTVYSYEVEKGDLLWEHNIGDPITASVYVDENIQLVSDSSISPKRLVCVCSSSGTVSLLLINSDVVAEKNESRSRVPEFARLQLHGDVFSSPVMIGGRIFVGCRDDYVYCITVTAHGPAEVYSSSGYCSKC